MASRSVDGVLTRHFLRRFLENDLISPDADRTQLLAVVGAGLFSVTLFVTMVMSALNYVAGVYTPGQAAIASLDDKVFYITLSMVTLALLAAAQWDALALDDRDAAILDPLPISRFTIRRAKVAAVALFGCAAAALVNLAPTVLFPPLLVVKQPVSLLDALVLVATHGLVVLSAAAFGYLSVLALRETLSALLSASLFRRVAPAIQGALIVLLGSALLLVPAASSGVEQLHLKRADFMYTPPAWFLGAYERLSGHVLVEASREGLRGRLQQADVRATAAYRTHDAQFELLAERAVRGLGSVILLLLTAYVANAFRRPTPIVVRHSTRPWLASGLSRAVLLRNPTARAGFHFTLAALWRSHTHRLTLAASGAAGLALSLVALLGVDVSELDSRGLVPARVLIVQPFLVGLLLVGFRHAIRVPATLPANWGFQLAWREDVRAFISGARRAAFVSVVLPALAMVFILDLTILGFEPALRHGAFGALGAVVFLEALMFGYHKVPFTCSYVPNEHMKALAPFYVAIFPAGAALFAGLESLALHTGDATFLVTTLGVIFGVLRMVSLVRRRVTTVAFDEGPVPTTQQLGLGA